MDATYQNGFFKLKKKKKNFSRSWKKTQLKERMFRDIGESPKISNFTRILNNKIIISTKNKTVIKRWMRRKMKKKKNKKFGQREQVVPLNFLELKLKKVMVTMMIMMSKKFSLICR